MTYLGSLAGAAGWTPAADRRCTDAVATGGFAGAASATRREADRP